jgi:glutaredoxin-related protein
MMNLKLFLNHRDNNPVFDEIKEGGRVGLPCLVIGNGDQIVFDVESLDIEDLKK